jgi:hypothetical protein
MDLPGYLLMMKKHKLRGGLMTSTSWKRCGVGHLYDPLDTSKGSAAIMIAISVHGYWNPETWFSARSRNLIT